MTAPMMKSLYTFTPADSWVEDFDAAIRDTSSRTQVISNFILLPELEKPMRQVLDQIYRQRGRGFFVTGLYGSGKTIFLAVISALLTESALLKHFLEEKPEWGLDELANRRYLTINFTAIANQVLSLEEAFWQAISQTLRSLNPPLEVSLSNTDAFLDAFSKRPSGFLNDVYQWLEEKQSIVRERLATFEKPYQKQAIDRALVGLGLGIDEKTTTIAEKVHLLVELAKERGFDGVAVFIDELYLHLIESNERFNQGTNFLSQVAQAGLAEGKPFWVFGAVQEEIQEIARQAGRNYDTDLMGRLAGQSGRFQNIGLLVTQFHQIYNHRLFRVNSKQIHKLANLFQQEIQPFSRGSFEEFFRRYFRNQQPITNEAEHFADLYPMHPYALNCLTKITNYGGRSRGALGFVDDFCRRAQSDNRLWKNFVVLDDIFNYEDLRNKIIQDEPSIRRYYDLYDRFYTQVQEEVLARTPYRRYSDPEKEFVKQASGRLIKALIVLAMVREELPMSRLNDALMLRWLGKESDLAERDENVRRLLEKIAETFAPLRVKGEGSQLTFFLTVEGYGGEREDLLAEIDKLKTSQESDLHLDPAYRAQLELFFRFPNSPLRDATPPQNGLKSWIEVDWQRTKRLVDYMLEAPADMAVDARVTEFVQNVPPSRSTHLLILYPSTLPLDTEIDKLMGRDGRVLLWLPAAIQAQDVDDIRQSMALVKLYGDYRSIVTGGGASASDRRKYDLLAEMLGMQQEGATSVQPAAKAIAALRRSFTQGRIVRWNPSEKIWETLLDPGQLLNQFSSIPAEQRSLRALVQSLAQIVLS